MRRTVAAGILAPLVLVLAACGSGSTTTPTPNTVVGNAPTTSTAPAGGGGKGNAAAGKVVFTKNCSACHTLSDAGATGSVGPNLDQLKPDDATVAHQVENGGGAMPAFKGTLSPQQIQDVAAYVSSVAGQ